LPALDFGHLRAQPALECGGLAPPFSLNMVGCGCRTVGTGRSCPTALLVVDPPKGAHKGRPYNSPTESKIGRVRNGCSRT